ncbi:MAG: hypothetical protein ABL951_02190 [Alphaproteobacteria bacterium]
MKEYGHMKIRYGFILPVLTVLMCAPVLADWDPVAEARYEAERKASQQAEEARQREMQAEKDKAQAAYDNQMQAHKREYLGAGGEGKSGAELDALYDAKIKRDTESGMQAAEAARKSLGSGNGAAAVKQVTGKTMQELENMTDEEAEALEREMLKKYGN